MHQALCLRGRSRGLLRLRRGPELLPPLQFIPDLLESSEAIDKRIAIDDCSYRSRHSVRSFSTNLRPSKHLCRQIPNPTSFRLLAFSFIKWPTARRTASARDIPCSSHRRASAPSCSSGKSTMVLMSDHRIRHHDIVKPEQAYQRLQRLPQTRLLKRMIRDIVNPEHLIGHSRKPG